MDLARALLCLAALAFLTLANAGAQERAGEEQSRTVRTLAERIDTLVEAGWKEAGIPPAPPADDATFLRRAWLDLAGHIPPLTEVRDFLDDEAPDKRRRMVARLLRDDAYARHTAALWVRSMMPAVNGRTEAGSEPPLQHWLYDQIRKGTPQDRVVRALVATSRGNAGSLEGLFVFGAQPEQLAAAASRLFLGVKIECAQCHDHPFADWKKEQFWQQAAFFTPSGTLPIPDTDRRVKAVFLDGRAPKPSEKPQRDALADWLTSPSNPYFARAAVNRIWARYTGTGLLDPIDEFGTSATPSHPELLDELARAFVAGGFDERLITEAILTSKVYQLSSLQTDARQADATKFARAAVRGLTPQQVVDNFRLVTGQTPRDERFRALFTGQAQPTGADSSILQALYLMNGSLMADATNPAKNPALRMLAASAKTHPERCVEELYQMVLSRPPRPAERERLVKYVREGGPGRQPQQAVADVLWTLLNSSEFLLNH